MAQQPDRSAHPPRCCQDPPRRSWSPSREAPVSCRPAGRTQLCPAPISSPGTPSHSRGSGESRGLRPPPWASAAAQEAPGVTGRGGGVAGQGLFTCLHGRSRDRSRSLSQHPLPRELPGPEHCPTPEGRVIPSAPPWPGLPEPKGEQGGRGKPGKCFEWGPSGLGTRPEPSRSCMGLWTWSRRHWRPDPAGSRLAAAGAVPLLQWEEAPDWLAEQI